MNRGALEAAVAGVGDPVVGTAFVVSSAGILVTCAHVVTEAHAEPGHEVTVSFPASNVTGRALVDARAFRDIDDGDLALLRLVGPLPAGIEPAPLGSCDGLEGRKLYGFGFPASKLEPAGVTVTGPTFGPVAGTRLLKLTSAEIQPGFSGGPLLDEEGGCVVGVIHAVRDQASVFGIPAETFAAVLAGARLQGADDLRDLAERTSAALLPRAAWPFPPRLDTPMAPDQAADLAAALRACASLDEQRPHQILSRLPQDMADAVVQRIAAAGGVEDRDRWAQALVEGCSTWVGGLSLLAAVLAELEPWRTAVAVRSFADRLVADRRAVCSEIALREAIDRAAPLARDQGRLRALAAAHVAGALRVDLERVEPRHRPAWVVRLLAEQRPALGEGPPLQVFLAALAARGATGEGPPSPAAKAIVGGLRKPHVFISYARKEARYAERVAADLEAHGLETWLDRRGIDENDDFTGAIEEAIRGASHMVVCLTKDVEERTHASFVRREIQYALARDEKRRAEVPPRRLPIIPVVFPGGELPLNICTWNAIHVGSDAEWEQRVPELLARLSAGHAAEAPPKYHDPESLVAYLRALHEWASEQLEESVHTMISLSATDAPEAVGARTAQILLKFSVSRAAAGTAKPPARYASFADAFARHHGRVLLLGAPGAGKTTTLVAFARDAAIARLGDPARPIPVLASVRTWDGHTTVPAWAASQVAGVDLTGLPLLYLLDGLDELPRRGPDEPDLRAELLDAVGRQLPDGPVVLSSRAAEYAELGKKAALTGAVTLEPPSDAQIRDYLAARGRIELWHALEGDDALREMARTPLLLALLSVAFTPVPGEPAPSLLGLDEGRIFDLYIHRRFVHETGRPEPLPFDEPTTRELLADLACERSVVLLAAELARRSALLDASRDALLGFGQRMHFLKRAADGTVQFIHRKLEDHCALPRAAELLRSADSHGARYVCFWLGMMGHRGLPVLFDALREGREHVRRDAAAELAHQGGPAVLPGLALALADREKHVRRYGEAAVRSLGAVAVPALLALVRTAEPRMRDGAIAGLVLCGEAAVTGLCDALRDPDADVRSRAAEGLGRIGDRAAAGPLVTVLDDLVAAVRVAAALALGTLGSPRALARLVTALRDPDGEVRASAITALAQLGESSAALPLIGALGDTEARVRACAAAALGWLQSNEAVAPLLALLDDSSSQVRKHAAASLVRIGGPEAVTGVLAALQDPDDDVRYGAAAELHHRVDPSLLPAVMAALHDRYALVREYAVYALAKLPGPAAIPALVEALGDANDLVRGAAAEALGNAGDASVVPALVPLLADAHAGAGVYAAKALGKLGGEAAERALIAALSGPGCHVDIDFGEGPQIRVTSVGRAVEEELAAIGTPEARAALEAWPGRGRREL